MALSRGLLVLSAGVMHAMACEGKVFDQVTRRLLLFGFVAVVRNVSVRRRFASTLDIRGGLRSGTAWWLHWWHSPWLADGDYCLAALVLRCAQAVREGVSLAVAFPGSMRQQWDMKSQEPLHRSLPPSPSFWTRLPGRPVLGFHGRLRTLRRSHLRRPLSRRNPMHSARQGQLDPPHAMPWDSLWCTSELLAGPHACWASSLPAWAAASAASAATRSSTTGRNRASPASPPWWLEPFSRRAPLENQWRLSFVLELSCLPRRDVALTRHAVKAMQRREARHTASC